MKEILKRTNKIFRLIVSCFIFIFFSFNSINISLIQSNVLGKKTNNVYEGIYEASWDSDINDLYDKNFVSSYYNHSTEYFSLDYIVSPVKNVFTNPNNIYVGYYNKKLQSVQYIYDDSLVYLKLQTELNKELQEVGKYRKINETTESFLWCNSKKSDIYIVLYKIATDDKNNVILAIANKKLIKEELNMKQNYDLPTSICYREET